MTELGLNSAQSLFFHLKLHLISPNNWSKQFTMSVFQPWACDPTCGHLELKNILIKIYFQLIIILHTDNLKQLYLSREYK